MRYLFTILFAIGLQAAPGEPLKTNSVTLRWEASKPEEMVEAYCVYYRTNLPIGMPVQPRSAVTNWTPPNTNGWQLLKVVATNQVTITRPAGAAPVFFTVTASNLLGESPFSNVAWTPAPPSHSDRKLNITAEQ